MYQNSGVTDGPQTCGAGGAPVLSTAVTFPKSNNAKHYSEELSIDFTHLLLSLRNLIKKRVPDNNELP